MSGHDRIPATVNTLVLAYADASCRRCSSSRSGTSFGDALNSEVVAAEVVAMIVGSTGLIAAVPITTALAAERLPPDVLRAETPGHAH
jgi:uncharacterized membrane protein